MLAGNWLGGMRYPDIYVTRFFFKNRLQKQRGCVVELGCGTGGKLSLFSEHGWDVGGVDYSDQLIDNARHNFKPFSSKSSFFVADLNTHIPGTLLRQEYFDCVLMLNILYYLQRGGAFQDGMPYGAYGQTFEQLSRQKSELLQNRI